MRTTVRERVEEESQGVGMERRNERAEEIRTRQDTKSIIASLNNVGADALANAIVARRKILILLLT